MPHAVSCYTPKKHKTRRKAQHTNSQALNTVIIEHEHALSPALAPPLNEPFL